MARPLRIEYPGAVYHITSRGNARQDIFIADEDRERFLEILASTVRRYNWLCHAYCLMGNHYHLLVETIDPTLSAGMRQLNGVYTQSFNRQHSRVGHVFQGRFKAILVEKDSYLLELCRYIVLNPVVAEITSRPDEYPWCSYGYTAGLRGKPEFLTTSWLLHQFSSNAVKAQELYRKFVWEGVSKQVVSPWENLRGQLVLGNDLFLSEIQNQVRNKKEHGEIPKPQRFSGRPALSDCFADVDLKDKVLRNAMIRDVYDNHGYSLKGIGDFIGLHYTTVSRVVNSK